MKQMKIAFLGYGNVGSAIAASALASGHQVTLSQNPANPDGATRAKNERPGLKKATVSAPEIAVENADIVVLAVPFDQIETTLIPLRTQLVGKVVIDATNPVGPGVVHGLESKISGSEKIAELIPDAEVVKGFSIYGFENFAKPPVGPAGQLPAMLIAGNNPNAKSKVSLLLKDMGWEPVDTGPLAAALNLEHLTLLFVRMVRVNGASPHFTWSVLRGTA